MHDIESMRSAAGLTSSLVSYFTNDSINKHPGLSACMESVAEKARTCILRETSYSNRMIFGRLSVVVLTISIPKLPNKYFQSVCPVNCALF